eukprot:1016676_1
MATILKVIVNVICIQYVYMIYQTTCADWTEIWFDYMASSNDWTESSTGYKKAQSSVYCHNGDCYKLSNAYIRRMTDVSEYVALRVQFDVTTRDVPSSESCDIYYSYSSSSASTMQLLIAIHPPDGNTTRYSKQKHDLPSAVSQGALWLWCKASTNESRYCYFDNLYLQGLTELPSTLNHTNLPSNITTTSNPSILVVSTEPSKSPTRTPVIHDMHVDELMSTVVTQTTLRLKAKTANDPFPFPIHHPKDMIFMFWLPLALLLCCVCTCLFLICRRIRTKKMQTQIERIDSFKAEHDISERQQILYWLRNDVALPEYFGLFIQQKYDSIAAIKGIKQYSELEEIGIKNPSHQGKIMKCIPMLKTHAAEDINAYDRLASASPTNAGDVVCDVEEQTSMNDTNKISHRSSITIPNNRKSIIQKDLEKSTLEERQQILYWLRNDVDLIEYFGLFIAHQYDSIAAIKSIKDASELNDIGIQNILHQTKIMSCIPMLNDALEVHLENGSDSESNEKPTNPVPMKENTIANRVKRQISKYSIAQHAITARHSSIAIANNKLIASEVYHPPNVIQARDSSEESVESLYDQRMSQTPPVEFEPGSPQYMANE